MRCLGLHRCNDAGFCVSCCIAAAAVFSPAEHTVLLVWLAVWSRILGSAAWAAAAQSELRLGPRLLCLSDRDAHRSLPRIRFGMSILLIFCYTRDVMLMRVL